MTLMDRFGEVASGDGLADSCHPLQQHRKNRNLLDAYFHGLWFATTCCGAESKREGREKVLDLALRLKARCDARELDEDLSVDDDGKFALIQEVATVCVASNVSGSFLDDFSKVWQSSGGDAVSLNRVGRSLSTWMQCEWRGLYESSESDETPSVAEEMPEKAEILTPISQIPRTIRIVGQRVKVDEVFLLSRNTNVELADSELMFTPGLGALKIIDSSIKIERCKFSVEKNGVPNFPSMDALFFILGQSEKGAKLELSGCEFHCAGRRGAVSWSGEVLIEDCKFFNVDSDSNCETGSVIHVRNPGSDDDGVRCVRTEFINCRCEGDKNALIRAPLIHVEECVFKNVRANAFFRWYGEKFPLVVRRSKFKDCECLNWIAKCWGVGVKTVFSQEAMGFFGCSFSNVRYNEKRICSLPITFETNVPEALYDADEVARKWKIEREDAPREIVPHLKADEPVARRRFVAEGRMLIESNGEAIFANVDFIVGKAGYVEIASTVKSVVFRNCEFFRVGTDQGRSGWLIESPSKAGISFENCRLNGNESLAAVKANGRLSFVCCKIANMYHWGDPIVSGEVVKFDRCVLRNLRGKQTSCVAMGNDLEIVRCVISQCQFEWKMFFVKGAGHSFVMRESKVKDSHAYSAIVWYKTDDGYALPFGFFDCCFVNVSYNQLSYATGLGVSTQIDMPEQEFDVKYELPNG